MSANIYVEKCRWELKPRNRTGHEATCVTVHVQRKPAKVVRPSITPGSLPSTIITDEHSDMQAYGIDLPTVALNSLWVGLCKRNPMRVISAMSISNVGMSNEYGDTYRVSGP